MPDLDVLEHYRTLQAPYECFVPANNWPSGTLKNTNYVLEVRISCHSLEKETTTTLRGSNSLVLGVPGAFSLSRGNTQQEIA